MHYWPQQIKTLNRQIHLLYLWKNVNFAQCFSVVGGRSFGNRCSTFLNVYLPHIIKGRGVAIYRKFKQHEQVWITFNKQIIDYL